MQTSLKDFDGSDFIKGAGGLKQICWYIVNSLFFKSSLLPLLGIKTYMLKLFGAEIGEGLVIKPCVNIKFHWKLVVGNNCWIGEKVWIDNLDNVSIGDNVCLSQGALLLT